MSGLAQELRDIRAALGDRLAQVGRAARTATPAVVAVRGAVFVLALAALELTVPIEVARPTAHLLLIVLAALPVWLPRSAAATAVLFVAGSGWLVTADPVVGWPGLWRLLLVGSLLYLMHTTTALAAVLPYDTVVVPAVLLRWLARAGAVLVLSGAFVLGLVMLIGQVYGRTYPAGSLAGLALAAALAWLLARLVRTG